MIDLKKLRELGQIYMPLVNWWLFVAIALAVLLFRNSGSSGGSSSSLRRFGVMEMKVAALFVQADGCYSAMIAAAQKEIK